MLPTQSISQLRRQLVSKEISPADLLRSVEQTILDTDSRIGAYLQRDFETALAEAEKADLSLPLGGIPIGIKDILNVAGQPMTCGSKILASKYVSPYDATVITRLRAAGAIPFGKMNMDEFAMGSSTENSALQVTRNPWDPERVPGGSSGGSAAAVAAGSAVATLGTDTGGSIRQPASFCGIVGLKPSYGRVSRYGCTAYASSLDQIGPMTRSVADAALLLQAIAGPDPADSTCRREAVPDYSQALEQNLRGLKVGLPKEYFGEGMDPEVRSLVEAAARLLAEAGAELQEITLPHSASAVATYYIIATAEASANLARFDGVRYGHRCEAPENLRDLYDRSRAEGFGAEVKRRIILGTYVLSSGYYEAYYGKAQKVRQLIRQDFSRVFEKVDVILGPTAPTPAFRFGAHTSDPLQMYLADIYTISANLAGLCGISLPCGFTAPADGTPALPVGLQFLAPPLAETVLLRAASGMEALLPPVPSPPISHCPGTELPEYGAAREPRPGGDSRLHPLPSTDPSG